MYTSIDSGRLINLKVVSKVKRGEKLNTRLHRFTIEDGAIFPPRFVLRWLGGESRDQTVDAIDALITGCVYQQGLGAREKENLVEQLIETSKGIRNLQATYCDDQTTCAGIEMVLEKITRFVNDNGRSLDTIEEEAETDG